MTRQLGKMSWGGKWSESLAAGLSSLTPMVRVYAFTYGWTDERPRLLTVMLAHRSRRPYACPCAFRACSLASCSCATSNPYTPRHSRESRGLSREVSRPPWGDFEAHAHS